MADFQMPGDEVLKFLLGSKGRRKVKSTVGGAIAEQAADLTSRFSGKSFEEEGILGAFKDPLTPRPEAKMAGEIARQALGGEPTQVAKASKAPGDKDPVLSANEKYVKKSAEQAAELGIPVSQTADFIKSKQTAERAALATGEGKVAKESPSLSNFLKNVGNQVFPGLTTDPRDLNKFQGSMQRLALMAPQAPQVVAGMQGIQDVIGSKPMTEKDQVNTTLKMLELEQLDTAEQSAITQAALYGNVDAMDLSEQIKASKKLFSDEDRKEAIRNLVEVSKRQTGRKFGKAGRGDASQGVKKSLKDINAQADAVWKAYQTGAI